MRRILLKKRLRANVSKRFVTFQYLSGVPAGGTKPYKNGVQKGRFSFPAIRHRRSAHNRKSALLRTDFLSGIHHLSGACSPPKSEQGGTLGRQEPRIFTSASDQRGLSVDNQAHP